MTNLIRRETACAKEIAGATNAASSHAPGQDEVELVTARGRSGATREPRAHRASMTIL